MPLQELLSSQRHEHECVVSRHLQLTDRLMATKGEMEREMAKVKGLLQVQGGSEGGGAVLRCCTVSCLL